MVLALHHVSQLTLSRACAKLQQFLFSRHAIRPRLRVRIDRIQTHGACLYAHALAMAQATSEANLHLELESTCAGAGALTLLLTHSAALVNTDQLPQKPPALLRLSCITAVTISGGAETLRCFLPDALVQQCPNLIELYLCRVIIHEEYRAPRLTCTSLQKLTLWEVDGMKSEGFRHHLLNLPSLTHLDMETGDPRDFEAGGVLWTAICRYSCQLKCLHTSRTEDCGPLPWTYNIQLPVLEELKTGAWINNDEAVQQLLDTAPNLKVVQLATITGLTNSFAQARCSWKELRLKEVYAADLVNLPLSSCKRLLSVGSFRLRNAERTQVTPAQISAAVEAVQAVGGLYFSEEANVALHTDDLAQLTAAAPLFEHLHGRAIVTVRKNGNDELTWMERQVLLAALGQHLKCMEFVSYSSAWPENPGAAAQPPELLPHIQVFSFVFPPEEAEAVQMVRAATRPFTLRVGDDSLRARLQQIAQEASHLLVTVIPE